MASRWLAAFLEAENGPLFVPESGASSANSAKSPQVGPNLTPIGTIGTNGTAEQTEANPRRADRTADQDADDREERAALIEYGASVPRGWAEGYAAVAAMSPPAGFSPERWHRIVDAAGNFIDRWAGIARECGWSDLDVFGCDRTRPDARFDCMGLVLLLDRCEIIGIDEDGADLITRTGSKLRYRRRAWPANTYGVAVDAALAMSHCSRFAPPRMPACGTRPAVHRSQLIGCMCPFSVIAGVADGLSGSARA
jgi:hypothetical protein